MGSRLGVGWGGKSENAMRKNIFAIATLFFSRTGSERVLLIKNDCRLSVQAAKEMDFPERLIVKRE